MLSLQSSQMPTTVVARHAAKRSRTWQVLVSVLDVDLSTTVIRSASGQIGGPVTSSSVIRMWRPRVYLSLLMRRLLSRYLL